MCDRTATRLVAGVLAAVWLAGCSGPSGAGSGSPAVASASAVTDASASIDVSVPADVLDPVLADAATRGRVDPSAVTIVHASAQTWPNGALGCPTPGAVYTQAVVRGWQIVVDAGGTRYDYRSSGPGRFKLCTSGAPGSGGSSGGSGAPG